MNHNPNGDPGSHNPRGNPQRGLRLPTITIDLPHIYLPQFTACTSCTHCLDAEACDVATCDRPDACACDSANGCESCEAGGICRHCGGKDDYAERGKDGLVCCWQCVDKETA